jgi:hypothetical protein
MELLHGRYSLEDDPIVVFMTRYLLALDEQASRLRKCIHRAEEAKIMTRKLHVQLVEDRAQAAVAESRETAIAETLKEAEDRHAQELKDAYIVTRAKRRMLALEDRELVILEGIPITSPGRRLYLEGPSAPLPTETSHEALEPEPASPSSPNHHRKMMVTHLLVQRKNHKCRRSDPPQHQWNEANELKISCTQFLLLSWGSEVYFAFVHPKEM